MAGRSAPRITGATMAAHVAQLVEQHDVEVVAHARGGRSWRKARRIAIRPVKTTVTYSTALHELGHVLGPWQTGGRLEAEAGAWRWALDNALPGTVTPVFHLDVRRSLASYARWAAIRNGWDLTHDRNGLPVIDVTGPVKPGAPKLPADDHPFWQLLGSGLED
jgi:hypothetical protein